MPVWNALLLVYERLDVRRGRRRFRHVLGEADVAAALQSFEAFPALATAVSDDQAQILPQVVRADRPLTPLTETGPGLYWPSPSDTRRELDRWAPPGWATREGSQGPQNCT